MRGPAALVVAAIALNLAVAAAALGGGQGDIRRLRPLQFQAPPTVLKETAEDDVQPPAAFDAIARPVRPSRALGHPANGRLLGGVQLPAAGPDWVTWDPVLKRSPDRGWRRWGTDRLLRVLVTVLAEFRRAHPGTPPVVVGDLSRPQGGSFGKQFGGLGHASHQNGLDVDVYYPRRDGLLRAAYKPAQVDVELAQDLVDRFVAAGAQRLFVGLRLGLRGPRRIVQAIPYHDDHVHVRIPNVAGGSGGGGALD